MKLSTDIHYIGVDDTDLDLFESQYIIPNGISYNSYLITDEKVAIMDTADHRKKREWWEHLRQTLGSRTPDYLVIHHLEPDHSGIIAEVLATYPHITLVTSAAAYKMLPQFFEDTDFSNRIHIVKEGDTLSLGTHTLQFFGAAMVHWPEVIVSYEQHTRTLFSADAFGKFGALTHDEDWACEARRYYFNICGKYGVQVQNLLKKLGAIDVSTICPLHGPILTENLNYYINLYDIWSRYDVETEGIFVAYASIHGGTAVAARRLTDLLRAKGTKKVVITDLCRCDMAEAVEDAFRYGTLVVAAASYDGGVFTPMHDFLHRLQSKNYQKRRVGIVENGSWAPCAGRVMREMLQSLKEITFVEPAVTIRSRLKTSDLPQLEALADALLA